jgi:hypothetical protein
MHFGIRMPIVPQNEMSRSSNEGPSGVGKRQREGHTARHRINCKPSRLMLARKHSDHFSRTHPIARSRHQRHTNKVRLSTHSCQSVHIGLTGGNLHRCRGCIRRLSLCSCPPSYNCSIERNQRHSPPHIYPNRWRRYTGRRSYNLPCSNMGLIPAANQPNSSQLAGRRCHRRSPRQ